MKTFMRIGNKYVEKKSVFIVAITTLMVLLTITTVIYSVYFKNKPEENKTLSEANITTTTVSVTKTTTETTVATSEATEASKDKEVVEVKCPENFYKYLKENGNTVENLGELDCEQLIVVKSSGTSAKISFFEFNDNIWSQVNGMTVQGYVGQEGVVTNMSEDVCGTPKGLYSVGKAFYAYDTPETGLESFQLTDDIYWVDDPDSAYYNQCVSGTENQDWNSAEHMIDYADAYKYGFVINYNEACEYNKGSAIFMHVGIVPTEGCVATAEGNILAYLKRLNANMNPYILIL